MDEAEFEEMYRGSVRRLIGVTYAACGDLQEAQDCVQEAFVRAWTHRRTLRTDAAPTAWVQVTALRLAVSGWRRRQAFRRSVIRGGPPPSTYPPDDAATVDVVRSLRRLPAQTRLVLALHYLADWSVQSVADHLGMPENTVKSHLHRGRALLRAELTPVTTTLQGSHDA